MIFMAVCLSADTHQHGVRNKGPSLIEGFGALCRQVNNRLTKTDRKVKTRFHLTCEQEENGVLFAVSCLCPHHRHVTVSLSRRDKQRSFTVCCYTAPGQESPLHLFQHQVVVQPTLQETQTIQKVPTMHGCTLPPRTSTHQ